MTMSWSKGLTKESDPRIAKLSNALKGRHLSELHKQKLSQSHMGDKNPMWKGESAGSSMGRERARRIMSTPEGFDTHHIDGNPMNNEDSNLKIVTRREHMQKDGRLDKLVEKNKHRSRERGKKVYKGKYICYVPRCPKCGYSGSLIARWNGYRDALNWNGPYFIINHLHHEYSPEKYRQLRSAGLTAGEARKKNCFTTSFDHICYFGKVYPGPEAYTFAKAIKPMIYTCPTCGAVFPSEETLTAHRAEIEKKGGVSEAGEPQT